MFVNVLVFYDDLLIFLVERFIEVFVYCCVCDIWSWDLLLCYFLVRLLIVLGWKLVKLESLDYFNFIVLVVLWGFEF